MNLIFIANGQAGEPIIWSDLILKQFSFDFIILLLTYQCYRNRSMDRLMEPSYNPSKLIADQSRLQKSDLDQFYQMHKATQNYIRHQERIYRRQSIVQLGKQNISQIVRSRMRTIPSKLNREQKIGDVSRTLNFINMKSKPIKGDYLQQIESAKSQIKLLSNSSIEIKESNYYQNLELLARIKQKQVPPSFKLYDNLIKLKRKHQHLLSNIQSNLDMNKSLIRIEKIRQYLSKKKIVEKRSEINVNTEKRIQQQNSGHGIINKQPNYSKSFQGLKYKKRKTQKDVQEDLKDINNYPKKMQSSKNKQKLVEYNKQGQVQIKRWDTDLQQYLCSEIEDQRSQIEPNKELSPLKTTKKMKKKKKRC